MKYGSLCMEPKILVKSFLIYCTSFQFTSSFPLTLGLLAEDICYLFKFFLMGKASQTMILRQVSLIIHKTLNLLFWIYSIIWWLFLLMCLPSSNSPNLILSQSQVWCTMEGKKPKRSVIYQSALSNSFLVLLNSTGWPQTGYVNTAQVRDSAYIVNMRIEKPSSYNFSFYAKNACDIDYILISSNHNDAEDFEEKQNLGDQCQERVKEVISIYHFYLSRLLKNINHILFLSFFYSM